MLSENSMDVLPDIFTWPEMSHDQTSAFPVRSPSLIATAGSEINSPSLSFAATVASMMMTSSLSSSSSLSSMLFAGTLPPPFALDAAPGDAESLPTVMKTMPNPATIVSMPTVDGEDVPQFQFDMFTTPKSTRLRPTAFVTKEAGSKVLATPPPPLLPPQSLSDVLQPDDVPRELGSGTTTPTKPSLSLPLPSSRKRKTPPPSSHDSASDSPGKEPVLHSETLLPMPEAFGFQPHTTNEALGFEPSPPFRDDDSNSDDKPMDVAAAGVAAVAAAGPFVPMSTDTDEKKDQEPRHEDDKKQDKTAESSPLQPRPQRQQPLTQTPDAVRAVTGKRLRVSQAAPSQTSGGHIRVGDIVLCYAHSPVQDPGNTSVTTEKRVPKKRGGKGPKPAQKMFAAMVVACVAETQSIVAARLRSFSDTAHMETTTDPHAHSGTPHLHQHVMTRSGQSTHPGRNCADANGDTNGSDVDGATSSVELLTIQPWEMCRQLTPVKKAFVQRAAQQHLLLGPMTLPFTFNPDVRVDRLDPNTLLTPRVCDSLLSDQSRQWLKECVLDQGVIPVILDFVSVHTEECVVHTRAFLVVRRTHAERVNFGTIALKCPIPTPRSDDPYNDFYSVMTRMWQTLGEHREVDVEEMAACVMLRSTHARSKCSEVLSWMAEQEAAKSAVICDYWFRVNSCNNYSGKNTTLRDIEYAPSGRSILTSTTTPTTTSVETKHTPSIKAITFTEADPQPQYAATAAAAVAATDAPVQRVDDGSSEGADNIDDDDDDDTTHNEDSDVLVINEAEAKRHKTELKQTHNPANKLYVSPYLQPGNMLLPSNQTLGDQGKSRAGGVVMLPRFTSSVAWHQYANDLIFELMFRPDPHMSPRKQSSVRVFESVLVVSSQDYNTWVRLASAFAHNHRERFQETHTELMLIGLDRINWNAQSALSSSGRNGGSRSSSSSDSSSAHHRTTARAAAMTALQLKRAHAQQQQQQQKQQKQQQRQRYTKRVAIIMDTVLTRWKPEQIACLDTYRLIVDRMETAEACPNLRRIYSRVRWFMHRTSLPQPVEFKCNVAHNVPALVDGVAADEHKGAGRSATSTTSMTPKNPSTHTLISAALELARQFGVSSETIARATTDPHAMACVLFPLFFHHSVTMQM